MDLGLRLRVDLQRDSHLDAAGLVAQGYLGLSGHP